MLSTLNTASSTGSGNRISLDGLCLGDVRDRGALDLMQSNARSNSCFPEHPIRFHVVLMVKSAHDNSFPLRQHLRSPA